MKRERSAIDDEIEQFLYGSATTTKAEAPSALTIEKLVEQIRQLEKECPPPPLMYGKTHPNGSPVQLNFDTMFLYGSERPDTEVTMHVLKDRTGRSPLPGTPIFLVNPELVRLNLNSGLNLNWDEPEPAPVTEAPKMTFKQFVRSRWYEYLLSIGPPVTIFSIAPFVATLTPWFYVIAPIATLFLGGITLFRQYNQWYPYYGPDGMLKKRKS